MRYAENTSVPVERSEAEIKSLLIRYGASQFMSGWSEEEAVIGFKAHDRFVKFRLPLPSRAEFKTKFDGRSRAHRTVSPEQASKAWEQACRQSWRALALVIKAKLEAVEAKITAFETEFLAHIVLPGGITVGEAIRPNIEEAYRTGKVPPLLGPAIEPGKKSKRGGDEG